MTGSVYTDLQPRGFLAKGCLRDLFTVVKEATSINVSIVRVSISRRYMTATSLEPGDADSDRVPGAVGGRVRSRGVVATLDFTSECVPLGFFQSFGRSRSDSHLHLIVQEFVIIFIYLLERGKKDDCVSIFGSEQIKINVQMYLKTNGRVRTDKDSRQNSHCHHPSWSPGVFFDNSGFAAVFLWQILNIT